MANSTIDLKKIGYDISLDLGGQDNSILLIGQTGTGKSYIAHEIINQLTHNNSPQDIKFVLFDLKRVEFQRPEAGDVNPEYLMRDVVVDPQQGLNVLDELAELATDPPTHFTFIYIEECDMAAHDQTRFDNAYAAIAKANPGTMAIMYSTSRPGADVVSEKLLKSTKTILASTMDAQTCQLLGISDTSNYPPRKFIIKRK